MAKEPVQLQAGAQIERWTVEQRLGEGSFGTVYKVSDNTGEFALKIEGCNEQVQLLKLEVYVLTELGKHDARHTCHVEDFGRFSSFNYVVMTLVGKTLRELRKEATDEHLSLGTALSVGIQALEALEDLHSLGFLHRDAKPRNYAVGRADTKDLRKVYLLDFGMARRYMNDQGVIRKPRQVTGFRGTVRYASISCHLQRELCRKDDLETWLYMQVEITTGNLPWKNLETINEVGESKKHCRQDAHELFGGCPIEYREMLTRIDNLKYYDTPDYQYFYTTMRKAIQTNKVQEFPYDWEK